MAFEARITETEAKIDAALRSPDVSLWAGVSAIAVVSLTVLEFCIQRIFVGNRPGVENTQALIEFMSTTSAGSLGVVLIDTFLMAFLIVFLGTFRQLINRVRRDLEWIADLTFGAGLVWVAVTLVGDSLAAGAALDTVGQPGDASAIRAQLEGHTMMFGPIGAVLTALVCLSAGYLTLLSHALPRWSGWFAIAVAGSNLVSVGTTWGGTSDSAFGATGGWGTAALATFPWLAWVGIVGIVTLRDRDRARARRAALIAVQTAT